MALSKVVVVVMMISFLRSLFLEPKKIRTQKSSPHIFLAPETPFCKAITECDTKLFNDFLLHFFNSPKSVL